MWSLVDIAKVREVASRALHYEVSVRYGKIERESGESGSVAGDIGAVLDEVVVARVPEDMREEVLAMAKSLLGAALSGPIGDAGEDGAAGSGPEAEQADEKEDALATSGDGA